MMDNLSDAEYAKMLQKQFDEEAEAYLHNKRKDEEMAASLSSDSLAEENWLPSLKKKNKETPLITDTGTSNKHAFNSSRSPVHVKPSKSLPSGSQIKNISEESKCTPVSVSKDIAEKNKNISTLPPCKYGIKCYRKNPSHFTEYSHPSGLKRNSHGENKSAVSLEAQQQLASLPSTSSGMSNVEDKFNNRMTKNKSKPGDLKSQLIAKSTESIAGTSTNDEKQSTLVSDALQCNEPPLKRSKLDGSRSKENATKSGFVQRLQRSNPFRFLLNKNFSVPATHKDPLSCVFQDLLHPKMGALKESLQLTFMADLEFLSEVYKSVGASKARLTLLCGQKDGELTLPNASVREVAMPFLYGTHHTKMMILRYEDGIRIVIHTANLVSDDWYEKTQGYWISPVFPKVDNGIAPDSPTQFRRDMLMYLQAYKLAELKLWCQVLIKHDFSRCNAVLIGHIPGYHSGDSLSLWGHMRLRRALSCHSDSAWRDLSNKGITTIIQCSSIGSLGKDHSTWLSTEFSKSLSGGMSSPAKQIKVVYPCEEDVKNSSQGWLGGSCLPYNSNTHAKQPWLQQHMHRWQSDKRGRTPAMPHIKTYTRLKEDSSSSYKAQYLLLTSANLSKAAWGTLQKHNTQLFIRSYELGVLLLPKFANGGDSFPLSGDCALPLPYDYPLTPYPSNTRPWFMDVPKTTPDVNGDTFP